MFSKRNKPYVFRVEHIDTTQYNRTLDIINTGLKKYPKKLLVNNLNKIYVFKKIWMQEIRCIGTVCMDSQNIFITNNGYSNSYIEETIHHEFSSILIRNYVDFFDVEAWEKLNKFEYLDVAGVEALEKKLNPDYDTTSLKKGILCEYSQINMHNDINVFAEGIMCNRYFFWDAVKKYPLIRAKAKLFLAFYYKIDPEFKSLIKMPEWFKLED